MGQFRKKPIVIEALGPISNNNILLIADWCGGQAKTSGSIIIKTLEGDMRAHCGDWVICGVNGEFYPCKPDIFAATYEDAAPPQGDLDCPRCRGGGCEWCGNTGHAPPHVEPGAAERQRQPVKLSEHFNTCLHCGRKSNPREQVKPCICATEARMVELARPLLEKSLYGEEQYRRAVELALLVDQTFGGGK
jgi:hypothetical protein